MIADPYPVIDPQGDLTPIVNVTFPGVEGRIASINFDDPQPPGYRYRLPLSREYDPWVERRDMVVAEGVYDPWARLNPWDEVVVGPLLSAPLPQGISYYEGGLWFHVGGSVYCWCSDPPDSDGDRVARGCSRSSYAHSVREAFQLGFAPGFSDDYLGFRLLRGPVA